MEERAPSPQPLPPSQILPPPPSTEPTARGSGTYIVQVPKDQIYRVPPPENAYLAERYQKPRGGGKSVRHPWQKGFVVLIIVAVSLVAAAAAFYFAVGPALPSFFVVSLQANSYSRVSPSMHYAVAVRIRNPSVRMGISYEGGGTAVLSNANGKIATTKIPSFFQKHGDTRTIFLNFTGPAQSKKTLSSPGTKRGVSFSLSLKFPMKMKVGAVKTAAMEAGILCSFSVSSLQESKALRQSCRFDL